MPIKKSPIIYTIGHSTHPIEKFVVILKNFKIKELIDVRTIPKSRFNPQFNQEALSRKLKLEHIICEHMPGLGGLRHAKKDSINKAWRNASFRGFADYMQTPEFDENLHQLIKKSKKHRTVIMCAEAVPWRCHRSLIADALTADGFEVRDIMSAHQDTVHKINPMAKIKEGKVHYPGEQMEF